MARPWKVTERHVTWYGNGPWKRTTLYKEQVAHNFATPHQDVLEQTVSYRVPADKVAMIAEFNGSVVVNRTRGELTSTYAVRHQLHRIRGGNGLSKAEEVCRP